MHIKHLRFSCYGRDLSSWCSIRPNLLFLQVMILGQAVAEEPLAVDTVGTMISEVVVTAMMTVTKGEMIGWIGGAHEMTTAGMTEVGLGGAQ